MNYCKTCRRHLNGAVSCPGCGATGLELSSVRDGRSPVQLPPVSGPRRAKSPARLPVPEAEPYEGDVVTGPEQDAGRGRHTDKPRLSVVSDADDATGVNAARSAGGGRRGISVADDGKDSGRRAARAAADEAKRSRSARRQEKRRGIGLMLTGGFAGIVVVAFLVYGNSGGGTEGSTAGSVVAVHGSGTGSAASLTMTVSTTIPASSARATSASASPTHTASSSPSPSKSSTPEQQTSSAAASTSATASATRTTASASPTSTTASASPSPSKTQSCWLIFCT